jgi:choline dehydrogenase-like flavoprotein
MPIHDASDLPPGTELQCDVAIVGGGAAGLALARELSRAKLKIVVLEAGGRNATRAAQRGYAGRYVSDLAGRPLAASRWRALGGSTVRWAGQCGRMLSSDFEQRPWVAHSGWPFGLTELESFYRRAESLLGLAAPALDRSIYVADDGDPVLMSHHFQFPRVVDFRDLFADELVAVGGPDIFLNAPVVDIEAGESGREVTRLVIRGRHGGELRCRARTFVLAGGGVENARLLLVSRSRYADGLGNGRDQVGRYFMDHPYFCSAVCDLDGVARIWPDSTVEEYARIHSKESVRVIQFDEAWLRRNELLNCGVMFIGRSRYKAHEDYLSEPVDNLHSLMELVAEGVAGYGETRRLMLGSGRGVVRIAAAYARALFPRQREQVLAVARTTLEPVPNPDSRVRLTARTDHLGVPLPEIDWRMGEQELDTLTRMHVALAAAMRQAGLAPPELRLARSAATGWPAPLQGGRHHIGTTRMHKDPSKGVVDGNCRVHGLENLFIAGSSVFPTASYVNPTLTILALAIRLGDHLKRHSRG